VDFVDFVNFVDFVSFVDFVVLRRTRTGSSYPENVQRYPKALRRTQS
jgi:hypothetical protein